jgi:hypothetical protein
MSLNILNQMEHLIFKKTIIILLLLVMHSNMEPKFKWYVLACRQHLTWIHVYLVIVLTIIYKSVTIYFLNICFGMFAIMITSQ